jgi:hypothetical protein
MLRFSVLLLLSRFFQVSGHAELVTPTPRTGSNDDKLTPFAAAGTTANNAADGCAGMPEGAAVATFSAGQRVPVSWRVTIAHPADVIDTGVRIALRYSPTDSFDSNILAGTVTGDANPLKAVSAGALGAQSHFVTLPSNKTCTKCTLQWMWAARADGGFYLGCADIQILAKAEGGPSFQNPYQPGAGPGGSGQNQMGQYGLAGSAFQLSLSLLPMTVVAAMSFYSLQRHPLV